MFIKGLIPNFIRHKLTQFPSDTGSYKISNYGYCVLGKEPEPNLGDFCQSNYCVWGLKMLSECYLALQAPDLSYI